ncbi:molybdopterin converting factor large subunit [Bacillus sp. TS-2]|nr:molybdopterin converting factor large subunit [Bacillus sp. TS-2]
MAMEVKKLNDRDFQITKEEIKVEEVMNKVIDRNAGAVNCFIGTVREMTNGKKTMYLAYEAYVPMAEKKLAEIGEEINQRWNGARVAITHRIGSLDISAIAVVIAVSTPHRHDAFEASRYAIERIKEIVPIWKKEHWENGEQWIGDQLEKNSYAEKPIKEEGES